MCCLALEVSSIHFVDLGFTQVLKQFSNCNTSMSVYMVTCACEKRYIGSTRRKIKVRIQEHVSRIRHGITKGPLAQHFIDCKHYLTDFNFIILEIVLQKMGEHWDLHTALLKRETYWIFKLYTIIPNPLNADIVYSVSLRL